MSQKRKRSPDLEKGLDKDDIFRSAPIEDRSSTFIGYFSPSVKPKDLQKLGEFKAASHKILGWRRESNQQSISGGMTYVTGYDDDGENYGGKRVEKVLDGMQVSGACVVARWYGGVLLGPVRFSHIEQCAREAVRDWQRSENEALSKKLKLELEANEKVNLVGVLAERDQSIVILRALAAEKDDALRKAKASDEEANQVSQNENQSVKAELKQRNLSAQPAIDYSTMPIERLRALDKARDATLSFLLKRIDKVEAELSQVQKPP